MVDLESSQRHFVDNAEQLSQAQRRCHNLAIEVDEMRSNMDKVDAASIDKRGAN